MKSIQIHSKGRHHWCTATISGSSLLPRYMLLSHKKHTEENFGVTRTPKSHCKKGNWFGTKNYSCKLLAGTQAESLMIYLTIIQFIVSSSLYCIYSLLMHATTANTRRIPTLTPTQQSSDGLSSYDASLQVAGIPLHCTYTTQYLSLPHCACC